MARDQNGNALHRRVGRARNPDGRVGWAATVWFGSDPATTIRRYVYATRQQAREGDISDDAGRHGKIGTIGQDGWRDE